MKTISSQQQRLVSWDVATTLDVITVQQQQQGGSSSNSEEEDKEKRLTTTTCDDNNDQTRNVKTTRSTSSRGVSTTTTMGLDCNNNNNNSTSTTDDLSHWIASTATTTSSTTSMTTTLKRKRSAHKRKGGQGGEGGRSRGSTTTTTTTTTKPSHHHLPDDGVHLSSPDPPSPLRSDVYDPLLLMEKEIVNDNKTKSGDSSSSSNKNNNNKATPCQHSLVLLSFLTMPDEIQLRIASYLVLQDVRRLFGTSTKLATLFHSNEADLLWKQQVQTIWPHCLAETTHYIQSSNNDSTSLSSFYNPQDVKYNMLLQLAHCIVPSCIDDELFPVCRWSRRFQRHVPLETSTTTTVTGGVSLLRTPPQPPLQWVHTNKGIRVVQFIGIVGTGDRCIRSNHPWKAPISLPLKYRSKTTTSSSLSPLARRVFCWNNSKKQQQQALSSQAQPSLSQSIMHVLPHLYPQVQPPTPPQQDQPTQQPQPGPLSRLFSSNHPNNHNITHDQQNRYPLTTFTTHRRLGGGGATSIPSNSSVLNRLRRGRSSTVSTTSSIMMRPQATPLSSEQPQEEQPQQQILQEDKNHYPRGDRVPPVIWKPFVVPFCCSNMQAANGGFQNESTLSSSSCTRMVHQNLTPRLVHYFEVTILPASDAVVPPNDVASSSSSRRSTTRTTRTTQHLLHHQPDDNHMARECVAIGLSRREFSLHTRMPGWDSWSFGYHGDDGGVFYETGHMLHEYGPSFGVDDVIGCGIDYLHHEICFTKNGNYLGPAWKHLDKCYGGDFYQHSWYPTVGMDTTCLIDCNFGIQDQQQEQNQQHRPFCFDLVQYMQQHQHFEALEQIVS